MNRALQYLNLLGIVALAVLCAIQWRTNRQLNLTVNDLERTRLEQLEQLAERDRLIQGYVVDLNEFRERLSLAEAQLKDLNVKLNTAVREQDQLKVANTQLIKQRDELIMAIDKWSAAVAERDATIKSSGEQAKTLTMERNQAVSRFNELAEKYNNLVKDWNKVQATHATTRGAEAN